MKPLRYGLAVGMFAGVLTGCAGLKGNSEADAQAGAAKDLAAACGVYELAKPATALLPSPYINAVIVIEGYVDGVCSNQAPFAVKLGTVAWVIKNAQVLKGLQAKADAILPVAERSGAAPTSWPEM